MKRYINFTSLFAALLVSSYIGLTAFRNPAPSRQDDDPPQYFPQTGHTVRDPFVKYFTEHGGVAQFGLPITDDYVDPSTHLLVQYFQDARLEWHPGNPDAYKVQLGLLGSELKEGTAPIPISEIPPANDPNCLYFPDTGHSVCYGFRDYWLKYGGLDRFGYPISQFTFVNGFLVQYFQRARLEWHPNGGGINGSNVVVAPLGSIYYNVSGFDPERLAPVGAAGHLGQVTTLSARASVFKPVAVAGDAQTAAVFVTDQFGQPVNGVAVTLIINYPDGAQHFDLQPTSAGGITYQAFALSNAKPGTIVPMTFVLTYPGLSETTTRTSFMIWY